MDVDSRFLSKNNDTADDFGGEGLTSLQTLSVSGSGFFRVLVGKHFGRKVVIKTIRKEFENDPVAATQLRKEFSMAFPLSSDNVAHVLSLIQIDGVPALEMEWCDGTDVRKLLASGIRHAEAIEIIRGILNGLIDIHRAGIVHRDIKPENVMYDPFRRTVKIIDFGCAYATGATALQGPNGTASYTPEDKMSPDSQPEPKDDLYALGVLAGELAEALKADTPADKAAKNRIDKFAKVLREGRFDSAESALRYFDRNPAPLRKYLIPVVASAGAIVLLLIFLLGRNPASENSSVKTLTPPVLPTDSTVAVAAITAAESDSTGDFAIVENLQPPALPQQTAEQQTQPPQSGNTGGTLRLGFPNAYTGVSAEDERIYAAAMYPGLYLEDGNTPGASLQSQMDAFVIHFVDSLRKDYQKAIANRQMLPRYFSNVKEMQDAAKKWARKYLKEMEKRFAEKFGTAGNPRRRAILLEGSIYGTYKTYHYRPDSGQPNAK